MTSIPIIKPNIYTHQYSEGGLSKSGNIKPFFISSTVAQTAASSLAALMLEFRIAVPSARHRIFGSAGLWKFKACYLQRCLILVE